MDIGAFTPLFNFSKCRRLQPFMSAISWSLSSVIRLT
nr:MAG TPA: hypothetical protein [Caudoviricetes sp.]